MEFHEKLQELRKQKGLTQEELAQQLYVSRAAVSKWESGRGYPSIDSLKLIAGFYAVTIDDLLSGKEALAIAEEDQKTQNQRLLHRIFGLLDLATVLVLFLPLFGQRENGFIRAVSLLALTKCSLWLKTAYCVFTATMVLWGILSLLFQGRLLRFVPVKRETVSLCLHISATLLFILSSQPYAASLLFLFLGMKVYFLIKYS